MLTTTQRRLLVAFIWVGLSLAAGYGLGRYFRPWQPGGSLFHPRPTGDEIIGGRQ